jgi:hypothetical protein
MSMDRSPYDFVIPQLPETFLAFNPFVALILELKQYLNKKNNSKRILAVVVSRASTRITWYHNVSDIFNSLIITIPMKIVFAHSLPFLFCSLL